MCNRPALDWLLSKQIDIENSLASRHLKKGSLILYDLTSTYVEGKITTFIFFK